MNIELDIQAARILIVDDQATNVKLLTRLLQDAGYTQVHWLRGGMPEWTAKGLPTQ